MMVLMFPALVGLWAGLAATGCMTAWEAVFFKWHGLEVCLDWEVNQHLISKVNGRTPDANLALGLAMHLIVGVGVGVGFALFVLPHSAPALVWIGLAVGVVLWGLLLPMRRFATGNAVGWMPALVSLVGHAIYGIVLAVVVIHLRGQ